MDDHLAISGGRAFYTDVSLGPPDLSGGPGPLGPHRNSTNDYGIL